METLTSQSHTVDDVMISYIQKYLIIMHTLIDVKPKHATSKVMRTLEIQKILPKNE